MIDSLIKKVLFQFPVIVSMRSKKSVAHREDFLDRCNETGREFDTVMSHRIAETQLEQNKKID